MDGPGERLIFIGESERFELKIDEENQHKDEGADAEKNER